jgi:hypothetical protein
MLMRCSSGRIVIAKASTLGEKSGVPHNKAILGLRSRELDSAILNGSMYSYAHSLYPLTKRRHVIRAARNPVPLDDKQISAVAARIEMDLRIGYAFTRYWTISLKSLGGIFSDTGPNGKARIFSYGNNIKPYRIP